MKIENVGIIERNYNGKIRKCLNTSRGIFIRINKSQWEMLHLDGTKTAYWQYIDGRYVYAAAKFSDVLKEYNELK